MFAALLLLDASVLYLVEHYGVYAKTSSEAKAEVFTESEETPEEIHQIVIYALWSASVPLGVTLFCMTGIALLNKSLDPPKTLVINSRILRLSVRLPAIVAIVCLPLFPTLSSSSWTGGAVTTLYIVFMFEWVAGLERNWRLVEPRDQYVNAPSAGE